MYVCIHVYSCLFEKKYVYVCMMIMADQDQDGSHIKGIDVSFYINLCL
jgi:DNA gyrase/topoisomerase IV subunit B